MAINIYPSPYTDAMVPYIKARGTATTTAGAWTKMTSWPTVESYRGISLSSGTFTVPTPGEYLAMLQLIVTTANSSSRVVASNGEYGYGHRWFFDDAPSAGEPYRTIVGSRLYTISSASPTFELYVYTGAAIGIDYVLQILYEGKT